MTKKDGETDIEAYAKIIKVLLEPFESDPILYMMILQATLGVEV